MATITINGKTFEAKPLLVGMIRKNPDAIKNMTGEVPEVDDRTDRAIALLKIAFPDLADEDFENSAPGVLWDAAFKAIQATYARPEEPAPAVN